MGKHLHEVLGWPGPLTHRQWRAWNAWLDREQTEPDRTAFYLMQVALEVARIPTSLLGGKGPKLTEFWLPLGESRPGDGGNGNGEGGEGGGGVGDPRSSTYCPEATGATLERWKAKLERLKWERGGAGPRPGESARPKPRQQLKPPERR